MSYHHHPITSWLAAVAFLAILGAGGVFFILAVRMRIRQLLMAKRPEVRWNEVPPASGTSSST
jgi:hypothetical protein